MTGKQRAVAIVLVISVAINLLLIGGIIGRVMSGGGPSARVVPDHVGWIVRSLDDERRRELRRDLIRHVRSARPLRQAMRDAQYAFERSVLADDFDAEKVRAALADLRRAHEQWQAASHEQMIDILARLTTEERQRIVELLPRSPGRPGDPATRRQTK